VRELAKRMLSKGGAPRSSRLVALAAAEQNSRAFLKFTLCSNVTRQYNTLHLTSSLRRLGEQRVT
jgi:hypothetical protein